MAPPKLLTIFTVFVIVPLSIASFYVGHNLPYAASRPENVGSQWAEESRLIKHSLFLDIAVGPERVIAVGERGHVLVSTDKGTNWAQVSTPTQSMLNSIAVADDRHSWIVGHDTLIMHSGDGGKTWARQMDTPVENIPLFDIWFTDNQHGIAVGARGLALMTHTGGKKWDLLSIVNKDQHLYAIAESLNDNLYVVGEFGSIFRSPDLGRTWHTLDSPYKGTFFGVLAHSNGTLLTFGQRGTVFRSENGSGKWQKIETGTKASLFNGIERSDGSIVIVGSGGTVLFSKDWGRTFSITLHKNLYDFAAIAEIREGQMLTVGEAGITHHNIRPLIGS